MTSLAQNALQLGMHERGLRYAEQGASYARQDGDTHSERDCYVLAAACFDGLDQPHAKIRALHSACQSCHQFQDYRWILDESPLQSQLGVLYSKGQLQFARDEAVRRGYGALLWVLQLHGTVLSTQELDVLDRFSRAQSLPQRHCHACGQFRSTQTCSRCHCVSYCSAQCRESAWQEHESACNLIFDRRRRFEGRPGSCSVSFIWAKLHDSFNVDGMLTQALAEVEEHRRLGSLDLVSSLCCLSISYSLAGFRDDAYLAALEAFDFSQTRVAPWFTLKLCVRFYLRLARTSQYYDREGFLEMAAALKNCMSDCPQEEVLPLRLLVAKCVTHSSLQHQITLYDEVQAILEHPECNSQLEYDCYMALANSFLRLGLAVLEHAAEGGGNNLEFALRYARRALGCTDERDYQTRVATYPLCAAILMKSGRLDEMSEMLENMAAMLRNVRSKQLLRKAFSEPPLCDLLSGGGSDIVRQVAVHRKYGCLLWALRVCGVKLTKQETKIEQRGSCNRRQVLCVECGVKPIKHFRCSRCKKAIYCSTVCQKAAWKLHKKVCFPIK